MHVVPKQVELNPSQIFFFFSVLNQALDCDMKNPEGKDPAKNAGGITPDFLHVLIPKYEASLFLDQLLDTE